MNRKAILMALTMGLMIPAIADEDVSGAEGEYTAELYIDGIRSDTVTFSD